MNQLNVDYRKTDLVLITLLGLFFLPFGIWNLWRFLSGGFSLRSLIFAIVPLVAFGAIFGLVFNAYRKSVKYLNDTVLVRRDGKRFDVPTMSRVVNRVRFKDFPDRRRLWRTEIHFADGESAWLIPMKIKNFTEVTQFVSSLPCEHTEVGA